MSTYTLPTPDEPAEEWGRLAVSIPGFRWMPGILNGADGTRYVGNGDFAWEDPHRHHASGIGPDDWPDPDDPATEGCLFALLGDERDSIMVLPNTKGLVEWHNGADFDVQSLPLGRACIAVVATLGEWPGGAE